MTGIIKACTLRGDYECETVSREKSGNQKSWKCIYDPNPNPGDSFAGRRFGYHDLYYGTCFDNFVDGTIFLNIRNGSKKRVVKTKFTYKLELIREAK